MGKPEDSAAFQLVFRLFRETGLGVLDYLEPHPASGDGETAFFTTRDWARDYPSEQAGKLRRR